MKLFHVISTSILGAVVAVGVGLAVANTQRLAKAEASPATYIEKPGTSLAAGDKVLITATSSANPAVNYYVPVSTSYTGSAISNSFRYSSIDEVDDSNLWTVEKNSSNYAFKFTKNSSTYYLTVSGTNTGDKTRISTTTTYKNWTIASTSYGYSLQNATASNYFGVYTSGSDWRVYGTANQSNFGGTGQRIHFYVPNGTLTTYTVTYSDGVSGTYKVNEVVENSTHNLVSFATTGFTAPSGKAFKCWSVGGVEREVGYGLKVTSDVTITAVWADLRTLTYSPISSSGTGTGTMVDPNAPYADGSTVTVLANEFNAPNEMRFKEWRTNSDGTGTKYVAGDTFTINANTTLYAIWEEQPPEVVITASNIAGFSNSYAERDWTYGSGKDAISGKIKAYKKDDDIQMNHNNTCYVYNTDAIPGYITGITFTKISGSTNLTAWVGDEILSSDPASGGVSNTTYTWSFDASAKKSFFRVATSGSTGARVASAITISYEKIATVPPESITLNDSSPITMDTYGYGKRNLVATVGPVNANDKTVTWGTSDAGVVTVANGVLTPKGVGTATVYATTVNYISDVATPNLKASVSVTVNQALYKRATFIPTATNTATQADDYLPDGFVSLNSNGSFDNDRKAIQLSGKSAIQTATFSIGGYGGMKITGIDMVVCSNASAGAGSLTVTGGTTEIFSIATAPFSDNSWNGAYDANPCQLYKDVPDYVLGSSEAVIFEFSGTVNSIYIYSISIRYLDYQLETWCAKFLSQITCNGTDAIVDDSNWDDLGIEFLYLPQDLQDIAATATADKDSESVIEQAMARYDIIIRKYGSSAHDDFIGRFGEGKINGTISSYTLSTNGLTPSTIALIITISAIASSSIIAFFLLRKFRKHY